MPTEFEISSSPSPEEAAAAIAAIERFLQDTAVATPAIDAGMPGWLRAALHDGVGSADPDQVW